MHLRFQYNKTALQSLNKQLNVRLRALPTLKNKESALRMEVKKAKAEVKKLAGEQEDLIREQDKNLRMWNEFDPGLVNVSEVKLGYRKIAGEKIPERADVLFHIQDFDVFVSPKWFLDGIEVLKKLLKLVIARDIAEKKMNMLEYARKKTTQKVNLFEKVQIPAYEDAIQKIKRYLEDEENLAKSAQKIVKKRQQKIEEAAL